MEFQKPSNSYICEGDLYNSLKGDSIVTRDEDRTIEL